MRKGSTIRNIVVGIGYIFVLLLIVGVVSSIGDEPEPTGLDTSGEDEDELTATSVSNEGETVTDGGTDTLTATQSPTPTSIASETSPTLTESAPTPTSTPAPAPDGESYTLSGSGNDVTDSFTTEGGLVVFDFEHDGTSNFQVQAVNSVGDEQYLVNEIGTYDGEVALYLPSDTWRLEVTADGTWNTGITQPRFNEQDIESLPTEANGKHAAWFGPFAFEGSTEVTFEIYGDSHAAVWLTNHQGEKVDLLHNEIGPYEGTALVTDTGNGLIIVDSDSAEWRIRIGE